MDVKIPCICSSDHTEDTVTLMDKLDFVRATAMRKSLSFIESDDESGRAAEVLARLTESYLLFGVVSWTLRDEKGKPIKVTHSAIRDHLLSRYDEATTVSDVADDMYQKVVLLPLVQKASMSSPPSPTNGSTYQPTVLSRKRPKPSKPSSTTTSPTGVTEATSSSLDGVSSSSQSSESAA